jgi:putative ABC transport system permease protein
MKAEYFSIAIRNLRRRGIRSWLTLLGVVIGIIAIVSLISLGDGLKLAVNSQFGVSSTEIITIQAGGMSGYGPPGSGVVNPLTESDAEAIEKLDKVQYTIPRRIETLSTEYNNKLVIGFGTDVPEGEKEKSMYETTDIEAETGRLLQDGDTNKIVIGHDMADKDKNGFEKTIAVGDSITIQEKDYRVVGILKKQGSFIWDKIILMKTPEMKSLLNLGEEVDLIAAKVVSKDLMTQAKEDIEKLLRNRRDVKIGQEDFEVSTPEAALSTVNSILTGVQIFIALIAAISIFVGAIGIVNTMTTSVMERTKEIGIMKAIGAKNSDIFFQFFIEAGMLGMVGGIIGVLVGLGIGFIGIQGINAFIGSQNPFEINWILAIATLLGSFLIGSIAGIAPAMKAASMNPVEALRK